MPKKFVVHNTKVVFDPQMGPAMIKGAKTTIIKAASKWKITGKAVCLLGDEKKVKLTTTYASGPFQAIIGKGELKIVPFAPGMQHVSPKHKVGGKPKLVQEAKKRFLVQFTVKKPAALILPNGGQLKDPAPIYFGNAYFDVKQKKETEA